MIILIILTNMPEGARANAQNTSVPQDTSTSSNTRTRPCASLPAQPSLRHSEIMNLLILMKGENKTKF